MFVENEEPEGIVHSKTTIAASTVSKTGAVSTDVKLDKIVLKKKVRTKSAKAMSVGSGEYNMMCILGLSSMNYYY